MGFEARAQIEMAVTDSEELGVEKPHMYAAGDNISHDGSREAEPTFFQTRMGSF